jgi:hypothetical protein
MKALNVFFILLFVFSAAVQYNDPDPYLWIPIYLYGAILCYLALKGKYNRYLYQIGFSFYLLYAVFLFIDTTGVQSWWLEHEAENIVQSMKATKPWIEETREFFGLILLCSALLINTFWISRKRKASSALDVSRQSV